VAEALRALPALHARLAADEDEASFAADLLTFEALRACARSDGVPRAMRSRFAIAAIVDDLTRGLVPIDPEPRAHELVFERRSVRWRAIS
jgi:hypothetical protein